MTSAVEIAGRRVAQGEPCYVIAEAGVNHNGDVALALRLVDAAADAGADAVKFQTFRADDVVSETAPKAEYQQRSTDAGESQRDMLRALELGPEQHERVLAHARERQLAFISTPFDMGSVDLLAELGLLPAYKIASPDVTNLPLLEHVARKGKPVILSTGMADLGEVEAAVSAIRAAGNDSIVVLHCVSAYPASPADVNLRAMSTLQHATGAPTGFSDHTTGIATPLAAVALGACMLEKHLTLDRGLPGPDHAASLEPPELRALVAGIRDVEAALGDGVKEPRPVELELRRLARRSLAAARDLEAGAVVDADALIALRPGTGIPPTALPALVGRRLRRDVRRGNLLGWEDVE